MSNQLTSVIKARVSSKEKKEFTKAAKKLLTTESLVLRDAMSKTIQRATEIDKSQLE